MFSFDGINQYALPSQALPPLDDFTIALRILIPTTLTGSILGAVSADDRIVVTANETLVGRTEVYVRGGGAEKVIRFPARSPGLYDGQVHSLVITRSAATVCAWVDDTYQRSNDFGGLQDETVSLELPVAIAASNVDGVLSSFLAVSVAEFAVWPYVLSDDEIAMLANGFSPKFMRIVPLHYWEGFDHRETVGGAWWTVTGVLLDEHPTVIQPDGTILSHPNPRRHGGYDVYVKEGVPATPGVDFPTRRVDRTVNGLSLLAAQLGLEPNKSYCTSVVPFNTSGHATERADAWIETDETGDPSAAPTPVFNVRVEVLAGGGARVRWTYDELAGTHIAEEFLIEIEGVGGALPDPDDVVVTHHPPRREYTHDLALSPEGLYRLRVLSRLDGKAITSVPWLEFRTDATPPAQSVLGLVAV
ncbi:MAG: hypothetical protein ABII12_17665 [Planctomycetota bacterium]